MCACAYARLHERASVRAHARVCVRVQVLLHVRVHVLASSRLPKCCMYEYSTCGFQLGKVAFRIGVSSASISASCLLDSVNVASKVTKLRV